MSIAQDFLNIRLEQIGFIDDPVEQILDPDQEIEILRKKKNAVLFEHYHQLPSIQDMADFIRDSLGHFQQVLGYLTRFMDKICSERITADLSIKAFAFSNGVSSTEFP